MAYSLVDGTAYHVPSALECLAIFFLLFWITLILFQIEAIVAGKLMLYRFTSCASDKELPGVSILKPIVGTEPNLARNLETFFELSYPKGKYEILFCFQDGEDSAIKLVQQLVETYPVVNAKIFTCAETIGVNPKINNMIQGYKDAKYEYLWICDSAIQVHPSTLLELVSHMSLDVGMVHQLPFVTTSQDFAGIVDKVYFGTQHAFLYLFANSLGLLCANGMSSLYNKTLLDDLGGLQAFSCYVAEDYFMSKAIFKRGYKVAFSSEPAMQNPSNYSLGRFQQRMLRWTRLRLTMEPFPSFLEPLTEQLVAGIFGSWAAWILWDVSVVLFFIKHLCLWFFLDYVLLRVVQGSNGQFPPVWKVLAAWLFREFSGLLFFIQAASGRRIAWRSTELKLMFGGKAELLERKKIQITY